MIFLAWKRNKDPYNVLSGGLVASALDAGSGGPGLSSE